MYSLSEASLLVIDEETHEYGKAYFPMGCVDLSFSEGFLISHALVVFARGDPDLTKD